MIQMMQQTIKNSTYHKFVRFSQEKIIELLVNHGADLDAKTKDGETPIGYIFIIERLNIVLQDTVILFL